VYDLLKHTIRPEFLNRIDETIMFEPLGREEVREIVEIQITQMKQRLQDNGFKLDVSNEAVDWLAQLGYDPQFGARPLKRVLQKKVMDELSKQILSGNLSINDEIMIDFDGNQLITTKIMGRPYGQGWSFLDISINNRKPPIADLPVMMDQNIVGRISLVGHKTARVMLITNSLSKTPVKLKQINFHAILQGQNSSKMILTHIKSDHEGGDSSKENAKVGDVLFTSGAGGVFPDGYPIAKICEIQQADHGLKITATPLIDFSAKKFIQIMNGSFHAINE
jgi:rod shape-determining protein MreC